MRLEKAEAAGEVVGAAEDQAGAVAARESDAAVATAESRPPRSTESADVPGLASGPLPRPYSWLPVTANMPSGRSKPGEQLQAAGAAAPVAQHVSGEKHEVGLEGSGPVDDLLEAPLVGGEEAGVHVGEMKDGDARPRGGQAGNRQFGPAAAGHWASKAMYAAAAAPTAAAAAPARKVLFRMRPIDRHGSAVPGAEWYRVPT